MLNKKSYVYLSLVFMVSLFIAFSVQAAEKPEGYPSQPIEVVVQYGAGGGSDNFVRNLMMPARRILGTAINITNMTGAAGVKAANYVLNQPADGYTIYNFSPEQLINTAFGRQNYKEEFAPLVQVQQDMSMFYVNPKAEYQTVQELIAYAKKNPGKVQFTGTTPASPDELIIMRFAKAAGIDVKYIPFDKAPKTHAAVLGGHLDVLHEEPGSVMSLIEAKKLIPIIVFNDKRLDKFPEVPCSVELGYNLTTGRWRGLAVKKGTPQPIIDYIAASLKKAYEKSSYQNYAKAALLDQRYGWKDPAEFGKFWDTEYESVKVVLKELGYIK
ncbi:MAG: tripartite tricarboxylate transporter substrate binding protein [Deltaproteobacteria bacterium]|uniref:tripartite tricarboxylate transporter substrate binding protein n=1 Tax=Desulfobacula sp. TaxID=2593537 RepID=UPI0019B7496C|nr:tripartite tricarboxylate transporter substrate binding protein [Candidatus Desulfobacula maris]MBL6992453.1 tripartite tricarboxylate transporter substrate binding protein [Desulfobacula sp.]